MSSCLTGGGRAAYRFESLNLDCIKSPSSSASWASNSSSPSSTLSESRNSPLAITTRKPRTPRKRPNQTYNEAAAILSTAYPKIFPTAKHLTEPSRSKLKKSQENTENNSHKSPLLLEPSALLMPFQVADDSRFLLNQPVLERPHLSKGFNPFEKSCLSREEIDSPGQYSSEMCKDDLDDFDAESMLDEEVGEGIDSIMGSMRMEDESSNDIDSCNNNTTQVGSFVYGYPVGLGLGYDYRMRREFIAARNVDERDWWRFPCVNVVDLNPNMHSAANIGAVDKNKKKKKVENKKSISEFVAKHSSSSTVKAKSDSSLACKQLGGEEDVPPLTNAGLLLKLDYGVVLNTWADKASPFAGDESGGNDVRARLAQIDLFSGRVREATVLRYKEKRRTRLFSKKIRYQVRKLNADRRPRMKGRFARTTNSAEE